MVPVVPSNNPGPMVIQSNPMSSALAEEAAEISEALMDPSEDPAPVLDPNRRVRLGLMDANSASSPTVVTAFGSSTRQTPAAGKDSILPARRYEDEVKNRAETPTKSGTPEVKEPEAIEAEAAPPSIEIERLGWFLARLQRAMTGDRRRRTGTTESWHRAMVTPELTISARNIKDEDAYMLDAVARILKKLLWEAWEE
jgi:hypothetical protein